MMKSESNEKNYFVNINSRSLWYIRTSVHLKMTFYKNWKSLHLLSGPRSINIYKWLNDKMRIYWRD